MERFLKRERTVGGVHVVSFVRFFFNFFFEIWSLVLVLHDFNPIAREAETGGSGEFQGSLDYIMSS